MDLSIHITVVFATGATCISRNWLGQAGPRKSYGEGCEQQLINVELSIVVVGCSVQKLLRRCNRLCV